MMLRRVCRKASKFSQTITQVDHFLIFSHIVNENSASEQNTVSVLLKVRCFFTRKLADDLIVSRSGSNQSPGSRSTNRVSRLARTEAQDVLLDYLYVTRGFSFLDAEHMSKNSPHFLKNLLSNIDYDKDFVRTLTKFLRYNPINEFEPFFESLGLEPSEFSSLLPRHLIYLSDVPALLENFHVLCNYGIPRDKIGKMYKEAREIFGYSCGLLDFKLQAHENLGLSKTTVIELVSCFPYLLVGDVDSELVSILEKLHRLGIKNNWIREYLSVRSSYNWKRMLDTMYFLDKVGYSEEQLHKLFKTNAALVFEGSGKKVYVFFGRLLKLGFKMNEVYSLFVQQQQFLSAKCEKNLWRAVNILFDIGMGVEDVANIVYRHIELLCSCSLKRPRTVCKGLRINKDMLSQIIREDPMKLFSLASRSEIKSSEQLAFQTSNRELEKTKFLLGLGYVENSDEMMNALKKFRGRGDQLQERFDCLVQAGLDSNDVLSLIDRVPMVLNLTKDTIEKKIDYLINCLGYPIESVLSFPAYFTYDMEKANHRFRMCAWLRDIGAAKPMFCLGTILACSEAKFAKYFVDIHPEGPAMWDRLRNTSG